MTRAFVRRIRDRLESSYWFTPLVMGVLAFLLAQVMLWLDARIPNEALSLNPFIYTAGPSETRTALIGLAGVILTTAGVVYSLLTLPMSVAASQFGSRLLRLFLRDRTTQIVLGMFVGTFVFCLTVSLSIPPETVNRDVPQLAASAGLYLALATFGSLILLIHHIGTALEAPNLVAAASAELHSVIQSSELLALPMPGGVSATATMAARSDDREARPIYSGGLGYVQAIDVDKIMALAVKHDLVIRIMRKPGHFAHAGELVALARPAEHVSDAVAGGIRDCCTLGNLRTPTQDVEYAVNQLAEVALRAMSAAINDPFTALTCLDHLATGLSLFAAREPQRGHIYDSANRLRLMFDPAELPDLLDAAFSMLRRASRETPGVLLGMLKALDTIAQKANLPEERAALLHHVELIQAEGDVSAAIAWDKERVSQRCDALRILLNAESGGVATSPAVEPNRPATYPHA